MVPLYSLQKMSGAQFINVYHVYVVQVLIDIKISWGFDSKGNSNNWWLTSGYILISNQVISRQKHDKLLKVL